MGVIAALPCSVWNFILFVEIVRSLAKLKTYMVSELLILTHLNGIDYGNEPCPH